MLLRSVRIENFRALRYAKICFDATTVLIGENDCGRSSVMEAVALALGWNSGESEFRFKPFHVHRSEQASPSGARLVSISLEFCESTEGEWHREAFEILRSALPAVLHRKRRFFLEVTHDGAGITHWTFRSARETLTDDRPMLRWLRQRMPVFWMAEGMMSGKHVDATAQTPDETGLAIEVSQHYRELLEGTALDLPAAIEHGSAAACRLLQARAKLRSSDTTPFSELLEEMTGKRKVRRFITSAELLRDNGTASQRLGMLLLTGALLHSGAGRVEAGMSPLTLIENPEAHLHPMTLASIWTLIDRTGGQKIIATHSGALLACARLSSIRRLTRRDGRVREWRVPEGALSADELRRYSYHLRSRRAEASFSRCWLLVEGETEYWLMAELARVCGYELASEGVTCVEFAQCGLSAVLKVARHLGIQWHLLADGDMAGERYVKAARECAGAGGCHNRFTLLPEPDVEHCLWRFGYADVFCRAAWPSRTSGDTSWQLRVSPKKVIARAIERYSKPWLAVLLLDAIIDRGPEGVPPPLRQAIETCVELARHS
jgi:putative ATP-dependent endonuclease of OLD family